MQRALVAIVAAVFILVGCGSPQKKRRKRSAEKEETAAEYQRRKAKESGELDEEGPAAGKWGGWRYEGARDTCRYRLGRKCFTERDEACRAARCKTECKVDGGGPATVSCAKG